MTTSPPSQLSRAGGSGAVSGSVAGRSPGRLSGGRAAWQCQSPGPRALRERRQSEEAGEHPQPVLGGLGLLERPGKRLGPGEGAVKGAWGGGPAGHWLDDSVNG